jgi:alpha-ketoglutarate-dependent taurine dioxygenase
MQSSAAVHFDSFDLSILDEQAGLPLVVSPKAGAGVEATGKAAFLRLWFDCRAELDQHLFDCGALLFRGFGIVDHPTFAAVISALKEDLLDYVDGNSPRTKLGKGVYTSTEYPPQYFISLHNELSYCSRWPARLFFCCVAEAEEGGQTPLVDSRLLLKALPVDLVEEFRAKQVRYVRCLHGGDGFGPSWQQTFETTNRADVEAYAKASGTNLRWNDDGSVFLSNTRPATAVHPGTGEEVWFNQADQFHPSTLPREIYESMLEIYEGCEDRLPQQATFGDGSPIPASYLEKVREVTRQQVVLFDWRQGDLLMFDNMLVAHGRMPFKGPRRILVAMTAR